MFVTRDMVWHTACGRVILPVGPTAERPDPGIGVCRTGFKRRQNRRVVFDPGHLLVDRLPCARGHVGTVQRDLVTRHPGGHLDTRYPPWRCGEHFIIKINSVKVPCPTLPLTT